MKAARLHAHGSDFGKNLSVESIELPPLAANEVRLEMLMAPINPADLNVIEGTYGQLPELPTIIGNEGVGRIVAKGSNVNILDVADLVATLDIGSWCSHRNAWADRLISLPADINLQQASMLCVNPPTAYALLQDFVALQPGDWLVQNAANSGVGRCVIQLAHHFGLRTLNIVRRAELAEELLALGGDRVVTEETDLRKESNVLMDGARAKLALNAVGGPSALNLANALEDGGFLVTYGAMGRQPLKIPNSLLIFRRLTFQGFWLRHWFEQKFSTERQRIFALLIEMIRTGALRVPIQSTFPLRDLQCALQKAITGHRKGKILLDLTVF